MEFANAFQDRFKMLWNSGIVGMVIGNETDTERRMWTENVLDSALYDFWKLESSLPLMRLSDLGNIFPFL